MQPKGAEISCSGSFDYFGFPDIQKYPLRGFPVYKGLKAKIKLGYCGKKFVTKANDPEHEILAPIDCIGIFVFV